MPTRNITLVTYRTLDAVDVEVSEDATCAVCSNPPIGGIVFPEPYEIDEDRLIHGDYLLCSEHIDTVPTNTTII